MSGCAPLTHDRISSLRYREVTRIPFYRLVNSAHFLTDIQFPSSDQHSQTGAPLTAEV